MDKYKMNYIFSGEKDMHDIFIKVLQQELQKYIRMICKSKKCGVLSSGTDLSLEGEKHCWIV